MKFGLTENIIERIIQVFENNSKVDKAFVFGSRAKGNYRPDSDIDIAIKGNDITLDDILKMSVAFEDKGIKNKIDLIDYHTIKETALVEHIDRVGIEFYSRWKEYRLGDIITFQRGHDLTRTDMGTGKYPVAGSNGIIGYHNSFTTKGPGVTIGRSGNIGTPHYYENDFWAHNTVLYIKDFKISEPKFIFYFLKTIDFTQFNAGSSVPTLNRNHIHELDFLLPPKEEQTSIASILSSLDNKIDLLNRQNKTLEQLAETLFRQWFVEEAEEQSEKQLLLGDLIESVSITHRFPNKNVIFLNTSDIYLGEVLVNEYSNVKSLPGQAKKTIQKDDILFSEIRPANGRWAYVDFVATDYVVSTKLMVLRSKNMISQAFAYFYLTHPKTVEWLAVLADSRSGTFPQITFDQLKDLKINIPSDSILNNSVKWCETSMEKIKSNTTQIRTLTKLRDTLLPKLMSGEVKVSNF